MAKDVAPPPVPTAEDMKAIRAVKDEDLPWMPPPPTMENRYLKKMKENPFVPIGTYVCSVNNVALWTRVDRWGSFIESLFSVV